MLMFPIFYLIDHLLESLLFVFPQLLEVLARSDVQLVLGLRLRGLERAGQNRDLK